MDMEGSWPGLQDLRPGPSESEPVVLTTCLQRTLLK
jgi:hypothetical protein